MASKLGNFPTAASLYEKAGNYTRAIHFYEKAGMASEAQALRIEHVNPKSDALSAHAPLAATEPSKNSLDSALSVRTSLHDAATPGEKSSAQIDARKAADDLVADGELEEAAKLYRDAELFDEALHLYCNVLGQPENAAPIVAKMGNHDRAAELSELAGQKERAAAALVRAAEATKQPVKYAKRIANLSPAVANSFLETAVANYPLNDEYVELYYQRATLLEQQGSNAEAITLFQSISNAFGAYLDSEQRLSNLMTAVASSKVATSASDDFTSAAQLRSEQIDTLAQEVADAAAKKLQSNLMVDPSLINGGRVVGIEKQPVKVSMLFDSEVQASRNGPSVDSLLQYVGNQEPSLQNIEVYYRLGLAHLGVGNWGAALEAFKSVEEISPGYRDASGRASEIREWQNAMGDNATKLKASGDSNKDSRYALRGELGRGGMAVVYRGDDTVLGREVALKFISEDFSADPDIREMFEREARAVAQLNHPNIVTIHDFGMLEGRVFICMEFVKGRTVEDLIFEDGGMTVVESLQVMSLALKGLSYAHSHHIIHCDIKPANIMRTDAGLVKLMDFGLAKSIESGSKSSFVAGTPAYMPPEQLAGTNVDHRADLFSMAVALYEMLSGELPFEGMRRDQIPKPIHELNPQVPKEVSAAMQKALQVEPMQRFQSAEDFASPIQQALAKISNRDKGKAPQGSQSAPTKKKAAEQRRTIIGAPNRGNRLGFANTVIKKK